MIRLADEGIPVGAIARALKKPSGDVWPVLREAKQNGLLLDLPAADWPPGARREERLPTSAPIRVSEADQLVSPLMVLFRLTPAEGRLLAVLFARKEITRTALYAALYGAESDVEPKTLDVLVCKIRAKLKPYQIRIETLWGRGYSLPSESVAALASAIREHNRSREENAA
ncbi:helix-turn-helix domain-containing protein [Enterovirga aerilata]|uniref:Winged helix-turn-helix domain-containing protein n=1 Tax=Enterovirga aerilata TaxID=2730920 RepID=A0A849I6C4_9HYPH|nr:helix-turn-helix domain-containing protein [Enterovirga sp. DB1703]NNM75032.1 winged helix-turn-helix domain-containing protein [Enterovirga sp. DB1703]